MTFDIRIEFSSAVETELAGDLTSGRILLDLRDHRIWDFDWSMVELLEHFATYWNYLLWEEECPLPVDVHSIDSFSTDVQRYLQERATPEQENIYYEFRQTHNISESFRGLWAPAVWVIRRGRRFHVWSDNVEAWVDADELVETFTKVGDDIAHRLVGSHDPRAEDVLALWSDRGRIEPSTLVSISTGHAVPTVEEISRFAHNHGTYWETARAPNELMAAARMVGSPIDPDEARKILDRVKACVSRPTPELDALSAEAVAELDVGMRAHDQGYALARWLRDRLSNKNERIEPRRVLEGWNVAIERIETSPVFDAVCCWGPHHGPAIVLNANGRHAQASEGRRATFAHEICHLLVDRSDALPFAEVLGGRVPRHLEERARAFAAELLIPQRVIEEQLAAGTSVKEMVEDVRDQFGVSREIISWQTKNSNAALSQADRWHLKTFVSHPNRFD